MTFGVETDESGAHQQLDRFTEAGGTMVDTADVYGGRAASQRPMISSARPSAYTSGAISLSSLPPTAITVAPSALPS